ncbi:MAG TPA: mechanosensitive ion channel family protein [Longimicrobiales bacterium]|nr:mechanosensitive ion channel family protein [Longimicrobiales bacterium]
MPVDLNDALQESWDKVQGWVEAIITHLPNFIAATVVLVVFWLVAKVARRTADRLLDRVSTHGPVKNLITRALYLAVLAAGLFVALGILELDKTVTSMLAGVGILGLALGFAFQDIAANFIAGILISVRRPFTDGHLIESNGYMGVVDTVDLRATVVRTFQGQIVRIPNAEVFQNPLVNYSQSGQRRVDIPLGVSYGDDLTRAREIAIAAVEEVENRDAAREVVCFYTEFGDSSINFLIAFWLATGGQAAYLAARSEAIVRLKEAFDANDITIPFPIRTLDFGVSGGRALAEELERAPGLRASS